MKKIVVIMCAALLCCGAATAQKKRTAAKANPLPLSNPPSAMLKKAKNGTMPSATTKPANF